MPVFTDNGPEFRVRATLDSTAALRGIRKLNADFAKNAVRWNAQAELVGRAGKLALAGLGAVVAPVLQTVSQATAAAREFTTKAAEVQSIATGRLANLDELEKYAAHAADAYGMEDALSGLYQAISAGATDAAEVSNRAAELAIAGVSDHKVAVDALTTATNAYKADALTAGEASDALFTAVRAGKTTLSELSGSIGKVAPLAATMGVSFDETTAALATLTLTGVSTGEAATQLRGVMAAVVKPTSQAKAAAAELGLEFNKASLETKGLSGFLDDIAASNPTTEQLSALFGRVDALQGVLALSADKGKAFKGTLDQMQDKAGSAQRAFELMSATLGAQVDRYKAVKNAAYTSLGRAVESSETARQALAAVNDAIVQVTETFRSPDGRAAVDAFLGSIAGGIADVIDAGLGLRQMFIDLYNYLLDMVRGVAAIPYALGSALDSVKKSLADGEWGSIGANAGKAAGEGWRAAFEAAKDDDSPRVSGASLIAEDLADKLRKVSNDASKRANMAPDERASYDKQNQREQAAASELYRQNQARRQAESQAASQAAAAKLQQDKAAADALKAQRAQAAADEAATRTRLDEEAAAAWQAFREAKQAHYDQLKEAELTYQGETIALREQWRQLTGEQDTLHNNAELQSMIAHQQQIKQQQQAFWSSTTSAAQSATGALTSSMIGLVQAGNASMGNVLKTLAISMGGFLIQMASAAVASGIAASTIGTPAAIGAGFALAAAAAAFSAWGASARSSLSARGEAALSGSITKDYTAAQNAADDYWEAYRENQAQESKQTFVVNFNGVVTDPDDVAKTIWEYNQRGNVLSGV